MLSHVCDCRKDHQNSADGYAQLLSAAPTPPAQPAERKPFDEDEQYTIDQAADMLEGYAQWIRESGANLEDHPYLPEIDMIVNDLRGIKP